MARAGSGIKRAAVVLLIIQIVLNGILSFSLYFQPAFYLILIASFPKRTNPAFILLIAFITGLLFDIISGGVWGINSAAATAAAMMSIIIKPKMFASESDHGKTEEDPTSLQQIFKFKYFIYILFITIIFSLFYIILDSMGFGPFPLNLYRFVISAFVNALVIWSMMMLFNFRRYNGNKIR